MAAVESRESPAEARPLDRYRPLFEIGKGGMGSVEVALERGEAGFERIVALKRMLPEAARDPRRTEMFVREARLAALLKHRNVVHAFELGEGDEPFMAMEYVEGEPLSRVLVAARDAGIAIPPRLAAHLMAEVCEGLHAAHGLVGENGAAMNLVHRDVSPHNVMVGFDGSVKLLDFGVAKVETMSGVTRTGEVKGKTAYMSPEQAMGEPLDRRSDLFSVGAVLFEVLTGQRMWGTGTDLEVLRRLALEEPPPLDVALEGKASASLVSLHARLVAREAAARPRDASEVARELRAFVGAPLEASAIAELMEQLFAGEAAARRRALDDALAMADPARAPALRATLVSVAPATPRDGTAPEASEPRAVHASRSTEAAPAATRTRRRVAAFVLAALCAGGGIALMARAPAKPAIDRAPAATTAAAPSPAAASAIAVAASASATPANATPANATPTEPTAHASSAPAPKPRASVSAAPARAKPAPKPAPTGHVDVDPEPF